MYGGSRSIEFQEQGETAHDEAITNSVVAWFLDATNKQITIGAVSIACGRRAVFPPDLSLRLEIKDTFFPRELTRPKYPQHLLRFKTRDYSWTFRLRSNYALYGTCCIRPEWAFMHCSGVPTSLSQLPCHPSECPSCHNKSLLPGCLPQNVSERQDHGLV